MNSRLSYVTGFIAFWFVLNFTKKLGINSVVFVCISSEYWSKSKFIRSKYKFWSLVKLVKRNAQMENFSIKYNRNVWFIGNNLLENCNIYANRTMSNERKVVRLIIFGKFTLDGLCKYTFLDSVCIQNTSSHSGTQRGYSPDYPLLNELGPNRL